MSKPIGPREAELRRQREAEAKPKPALADIAATLPATSGKKPVKRRRHK